MRRTWTILAILMAAILAPVVGPSTGIAAPAVTAISIGNDGWVTGDPAYPVTVVTADDASFTVSWPVMGNYGYTVRVTTGDETQTITSAPVIGNTWTSPRSLAPASPYLIQIVANLALHGTATPITRITTAPAAPVNLRASATATSITATWSPAKGATRYLVTAGNQSQIVTSPSAAFTQLTARSSYDLTVTAQNPHSGGTVAATIKTATTPPAALRVTRRTATTLTVNWAPTPAATSYHVSLAGHRVSYSTTGTAIIIAGLKPGTRYRVSVSANSAGFPPGIAAVSGDTAKTKPKVTIKKTKKTKKITVTKVAAGTKIRIQVPRGAKWRLIRLIRASKSGKATVTIRTATRIRVTINETARTIRVVRSK
ncbi:hypothetical protein GCM10010401_09070 [Rarobacter faecitabidus]|uniref:Fibronectin type III domain protein n=1 Tax=Rarobacter faecitabidus TaxID=13243 RepID=A0A542ZAX8_RARFA|nr:fibronectin type III domain-containing protein [Rarobacter faecitabidus]TQL57507.1 fibronectin type III domain protein [Rarobacter faecitabidus]